MGCNKGAPLVSPVVLFLKRTKDFCSCAARLNLPRPLLTKEGLHLSFVFPPLREGKKQEMACHLLLRFGIAGRRDLFFKSLS